MWERRYFPFLLTLPATAVIALVVIYPIGYAGSLAFQNWNLRRGAASGAFIGLGNFERLVTDSVFLQSLANTAYYVVVSVTLEFLAGLALALILHGSFRGVAIIRSIIMMPLFIVPVVIALIWRILYNQQFGPIYYVLQSLGLTSTDSQFGLANPQWAMLLIAGTSVWQIMPFVFLILVAGMQSVPIEQYEAAKIDGANTLQEFLHITLPWLKPLIMFILLFRVMESLKVFDLVIMLTGGGPGSVTEVTSLYIYRQAFQYMNMGYASALAFVLLAVVLVFSVILVRVMRVQKTV